MPKAKLQFSEHHEVDPRLIPNVAVEETTATCWIEMIHVTNKTGVSATVTVADRQGTPIPILQDVPIDAGAELHRNYTGGVKMVDGFTFVSSVDDALTFRCKYSR